MVHALLGIMLGGLAPVAAAQAQEDPAAVAGKPNWTISPTVSIDGTQTDNVNPGSGAKKSDFITRLSPGIRIEGSSARASGNLAYNWQQYAYADDSARNNQQRSMVARGKLELVEQWLFIEAQNNISQHAVSTFGTQGIGNELINANRTETSSYQWSPYIHGRLAGSADYELRYTHSRSRADAGVLSASSGSSAGIWTGRLSGATPLTLFGWSITAERQRIEHGALTDIQSGRLLGTLEYRVDPQVRLFLGAGRETDNYSAAEWQRRGTSSVGIDWAPTERTKIALKKDRRTFGDGFAFDFNHRTGMSAWKFSDSRDVTLPTQQLAQVPLGPAYDLLNLQLTSRIPDGAERARVASQMLQQAGIPADTQALGAIMTSQVYVQRRQQASLGLMGVNNTVTLAAERSISDKIGTGIGLTDDFALTSRIRQTGLIGSWSHKLSPHSALTLNASTSRSSGSTGNLDTRLRSGSLLLTTKLGMRTAATLGLRQTSSDNATGINYDEQAITGSLFVAF